VIKDSFETSGNICYRASASRRLIRLALYRPARVAIAILAFVGCLNFASTERARAQEPMSCKDKCQSVENLCHNQGGTDEMCAYDKKECLEKCDEKK
jgi:hypothetical protein